MAPLRSNGVEFVEEEDAGLKAKKTKKFSKVSGRVFVLDTAFIERTFENLSAPWQRWRAQRHRVLPALIAQCTC